MATQPTAVYADFANDEATLGWAISRMLDVPFIFRDHASYNPQLLGEKLSQAKHVWGCSRANCAELVAVARPSDEGKIRVAYLGVDIDTWRPTLEDPSDRPHIVCTASLQAKKGHFTLLEAFAKVHESYPTARLVIVGEGPDRSRICQEIDALELADVVDLVGSVSSRKVRREVQGAAVFCLAAERTPDGQQDGIPVALMEAMACGVPTVSTRISGIPELITDGESGLLVPPRDPNALSGAILRLLQDQAFASQVGARGRAVVSERFNAARNYRWSGCEIMKSAAMLHGSAE
ncbi:MAG: glycosyltransferase [Actinomycetota bacterium]|nr:glycosyltransferase [Actinomycetota bacterium]